MEKPAGAEVIQPVGQKTTDDFVDRYTNHSHFEANTFDLKLVFGQTDQRAGANVVINQHTAITMSWPQAKLLAYFLKSHVAAYEAIHGRIALDPGIIQPPVNISRDLPPLVQRDVAEKVWSLSKKFYDEFAKENPEILGHDHK